MNLLEQFVRTQSAQALGWALAHSIWQGAAAAAIVGLALWTTRSARTRYAVACGAMLLLLVSFAVTIIGAAQGPEPIAMQTELRRLMPARAGNAWQPVVAPETAAAFVPWLAPIWAAGVLVFHLRALAGWSAARRMRTFAVCAVAEEWRVRLDSLRQQLGVSRPVTLLESGLARGPVVAGHLRPIILVPAGLLAGLPAAHVEAILLHELAHIRRADYLVNVFQLWAEAIFFYHPAAWWISRVIHDEREHCCDDLAVAIQGDARQYATALTVLEQHRWSTEPAVAAKGGNLVRRIRRLLQPRESHSAFAPVLTATILNVAAGAALLAWQLPDQTPGPQAPAPQTPPARAAQSTPSRIRRGPRPRRPGSLSQVDQRGRDLYHRRP